MNAFGVVGWIAVASALAVGMGACAADATSGTAADPSSDGGLLGSASGDAATSPVDAASSARDSGSSLDDAGADAGPPSACIITATATNAAPLGRAGAADEYALSVEAKSASATSWAQIGNEALVLEVLRGTTLVGHLVLHQGADKFTYAMHVGALAANEALSVRVSPLSAPLAEKSACISRVTLTPASAMGAAGEGMLHAPIVKWPKNKAFDDLPVLIGWSMTQKNYQLAYTNENGGTTALCGGGALGMRSEIARWSRGLDMEGIYGYGGAGAFERCTGTVAPSLDAPRLDALHPVVYYGDGHNRLFENRGGYGQACGTASDAKADGDIAGWNTANPGNDLAHDDAFTIVLRPLPVDMDAVGVTHFGGRREAIVDTYAPWLYRLTDSELARENKIDRTNTFVMRRYLMVDVYAMDVGGSGDKTCGFGASASGGFVLRVTSTGGVVSNGPQMTADYFGGENNVKRIAVPLPDGVTAADVTRMAFDAYDGDGIYFLALGDAFIATPSGSNGAALEYVHKGKTAVGVYVDDDSSGCVAGKNTKDGIDYPCAGSFFDFTP